MPMKNNVQDSRSMQPVEEVLRGDLQRCDAMIATTRPILRHLLSSGDQSLFSDEVVARVRGMMAHVARQLLYALAKADDVDDCGAYADERQDGLAQMLFEDTAFLSHAHALTIEMQVADRLQQRSGIDSVLSPLLQELLASSEEGTAAAAMGVLAAQARFVQQVRRMELPLDELPGDLLHRAILLLRHSASDHPAVDAAEDALRATFNESESRLGRISHLVIALDRQATRALSIDHAGLAVFATALAVASDQDRNLAILSLAENQTVRLALSLRAAGLKQGALEEQFLYLHPEVTLHSDFGAITSGAAAAMLASSQVEPLA
jgi:hypothetical protein